MSIHKKTIIGIGIMIILVLSMSTYAQEALPKITDAEHKAVFDRTQTSIAALESAKGKPDWNSPAANNLRQIVATDLANYDTTSIPGDWSEYNTKPPTPVADQIVDDQQAVVETTTGTGNKGPNWGLAIALAVIGMGAGGAAVGVGLNKQKKLLKGENTHLKNQMAADQKKVEDRARDIGKIKELLNERVEKIKVIDTLVKVEKKEDLPAKIQEKAEDILKHFREIDQDINPKIKHAVQVLINDMIATAKQLKAEEQVMPKIETNLKDLGEKLKEIDISKIIEEVKNSETVNDDNVRHILASLKYQLGSLVMIGKIMEGEQPHLFPKKEELNKLVTRQVNNESREHYLFVHVFWMLDENTKKMGSYFENVQKNDGDFYKRMQELMAIKDKISKHLETFVSDAEKLKALDKKIQDKVVKGGAKININTLQEIGTSIQELKPKLTTEQLERVETALGGYLMKHKKSMDSKFKTNRIFSEGATVELKMIWGITNYHNGEIFLKLEHITGLDSPPEAKINQFKVNLFEISKYLKEQIVDAMRTELKRDVETGMKLLKGYEESANVVDGVDSAKYLREKQLLLNNLEKVLNPCRHLGLVTKEEAIYIRRAAVQMSSEELKVPTPKTMGILGYNAKMKQKPMKDLWDENGYKGVINAYIGTRDTDGYFIVLDDKIVYNYQPPQKKGAPVKSVKSGYADYPEARIYLEKLMREGLTNLNRVIYLKGGTDKRSKQQTKEWFAMAFKSKKFKHIKYFSSL